MTEEERQEFFNKVKGRRIRWSDWNTFTYFLPKARLGGGMIEGTLYSQAGSRGWAAFFICNGFASDGLAGWEYCQDNRNFMIFE